MAKCQKFVCGTGDRTKAGEAFQKLQALDSSSSASAKMLGQLARASAQGNPQQALALSSSLPPLPKLTGISLDDLEAKVAGRSHTADTASSLLHSFLMSAHISVLSAFYLLGSALVTTAECELRNCTILDMLGQVLASLKLRHDGLCM